MIACVSAALFLSVYTYHISSLRWQHGAGSTGHTAGHYFEITGIYFSKCHFASSGGLSLNQCPILDTHVWVCFHTNKYPTFDYIQDTIALMNNLVINFSEHDSNITARLWWNSLGLNFSLRLLFPFIRYSVTLHITVLQTKVSQTVPVLYYHN